VATREKSRTHTGFEEDIEAAFAKAFEEDLGAAGKISGR
jgi:hypothetical protein